MVRSEWLRNKFCNVVNSFSKQLSAKDCVIDRQDSKISKLKKKNKKLKRIVRDQQKFINSVSAMDSSSSSDSDLYNEIFGLFIRIFV